MSEWIEEALGELASVEIGGTPSRDVPAYWAGPNEEGIPWVSIADLGPHYIRETKERITPRGFHSSNVKHVPRGTLLMSFKLTIGRAGVADCDLTTNEAIAAITPKDARIDADFLYYQLPPVSRVAITDSAIKGNTLNKQKLAALRLRYPKDPTQQRRIAEILGTVDEAIAATEALIVKQQQMKAGLMHDLFTRGVWTKAELDRGAHKGLPSEALAEEGHLRPSLAEAPDLYDETPLGWLPKGWSVRPLSSFTQHDITYGIVQAGPHIEGGVPYIRTGDMAGEALVREEMLCTSRSIADSYRRSQVREGEIVCAIRATVGKVLPVPDELDGANLTQGTARIAPNLETDAAFLLWAIRNDRTQRSISISIKGTTFMEITLGDLRRLPVAAPLSSDEQKLIGLRLNVSSAAIAAEAAHLGKLRQLKQGLMQALLTPPS